MAHAPSSGVDPSTVTCADVAPDGCGTEPTIDLLCASTCGYDTACPTADAAVAVLLSGDNDGGHTATCATILSSHAWHADAMAGSISHPHTAEELAAMATLFPIAREICGLPKASRARKMADAPPGDASKLTAAILRSTKTMLRRLAQVA